jgi:hypothetical protein
LSAYKKNPAALVSGRIRESVSGDEVCAPQGPNFDSSRVNARMPMSIQQHMAAALQARQHAQPHANMRLLVARLDVGERDTAVIRVIGFLMAVETSDSERLSAPGGAVKRR